MKKLDEFLMTVAKKLQKNQVQTVRANRTIVNIGNAEKSAISGISVFSDFSSTGYDWESNEQEIQKQWDGMTDNLYVDPGIYDSGIFALVSKVFLSMHLHLPAFIDSRVHGTDGSNFIVNSHVVSFSLSPEPENITANPLTFTVKHIQEQPRVPMNFLI